MAGMEPTKLLAQKVIIVGQDSRTRNKFAGQHRKRGRSRTCTRKIKERIPNLPS